MSSLPSGLFPSGFLAEILYALLVSPKHATCPTHLITLKAYLHWQLQDSYRTFVCDCMEHSVLDKCVTFVLYKLQAENLHSGII
jgi:hypothetical protein